MILRNTFVDSLADVCEDEGIWLNQNVLYNSQGAVIGRIECSHLGEKEVSINLIAIFSEFRNQGLFDQIVRLITVTSDKYGYIVELLPLPTEAKDFASSDISPEKLKSIYVKHGFKAEFDDMELSIHRRYPKLLVVSE